MFTHISCGYVRFVIFAVAKFTPEQYVIVKVPWKKETLKETNTLSCTFVFLEYLNSPLGTSKTVMWSGFGWRSWCESQSRASSCFLPGESESVSCFLAGTGSGGVNRGNPTCWRGNSTVSSYTHPAGTLETTSRLFLSLSLSPPYTHTCTHGCIATHLSTHVHAQSPSCPQFGTMDFFKVSGRDNNLNCICSLKIFCFVPFSNFCWYPLSELCFRMHSMKCGNFMYVLWWWLISPWQRILTARWKTKREKSCDGKKNEWLWHALNMITIVMQ